MFDAQWVESMDELVECDCICTFLTFESYKLIVRILIFRVTETISSLSVSLSLICNKLGLFVSV